MEGVADNSDEEYIYINSDADAMPNSTQPAGGDNMENNTACEKDTPQPTSGTSKKRKDKADTNEPSMAVVLDNFCRAIVEWRETLASRIGYEKNLGQLRTQVYCLLSNVPGLSIFDKLDATKLIGARNEHLEIFM